MQPQHSEVAALAEIPVRSVALIAYSTEVLFNTFLGPSDTPLAWTIYFCNRPARLCYRMDVDEEGPS